jgi:hypothetical protein
MPPSVLTQPSRGAARSRPDRAVRAKCQAIGATQRVRAILRLAAPARQPTDSGFGVARLSSATRICSDHNLVLVPLPLISIANCPRSPRWRMLGPSSSLPKAQGTPRHQARDPRPAPAGQRRGGRLRQY